MSRRPCLLGAAAALALLLACSGTPGGGAGNGASPIVSFDASPTTLRPGATVALRPVFTRGSGRVEPDVGPVQSGLEYVVGPFTTSRTYALVVTDGAAEHRRTLDVPFGYAHAIRSIPPSPLARDEHATVRLPDGRVLIAGGHSPGPTGWLDTEIFDPATGAFTLSGDLLVTRWNAPTVLLASGDVAIVGGETNSATLEDATAVQRWDRSTGRWSIVAHLLANRNGHTATALAGGKVLVVGGVAADSELLDVDAGTSRAPAGGTGLRRFGHTATLLLDGRVLLAGGWDASNGTLALQAEVFDPETETFAPAGTLHVGRANPIAERLADGRVVIAGGDTLEDVSGNLTATAAAEIWDAASGEFTSTGSLAIGRGFAASARLADGSILVAGGIGPDERALDEIETFDPATGQWTGRAALPSPRIGLALAALEDGRVLVTGGSPIGGLPITDAELYE